MKISCLRTDLANAVSNVSRAVSSKAAIPALEGVLIKAYDNSLNISGYNLEIGITTDIDVTIQEEGEIVVSAKLFLDIVRKLPEEIVMIETDERMVTYITCGNVDYQIVGMSSIEYPDLPTFEQTDMITVNAKTLREMIRQTVYAVSDNNAKPIYTGSLFEIEDGLFRIVAIDGYRMAIRSENVDSESKNKFVVPGKTQLEVLKLLGDDEQNVDIIIGQRHITFKVDNYRVISRLIEGNFIDFCVDITAHEGIRGTCKSTKKNSVRCGPVIDASAHDVININSKAEIGVLKTIVPLIEVCRGVVSQIGPTSNAPPTSSSATEVFV